MLRTHPDHYLAIETGLTKRDMVEPPNNTVLWMDVTSSLAITMEADQLKQWLKPGRCAVIIVDCSRGLPAASRDRVAAAAGP